MPANVFAVGSARLKKLSVRRNPSRDDWDLRWEVKYRLFACNFPLIRQFCQVMAKQAKTDNPEENQRKFQSEKRQQRQADESQPGEQQGEGGQ
ncbi:MAG: hypothetical protein PHE55_02100 [Methylococcaceae bacterium]|nr:hypothetical protein [Methylococcaceae bacterium]